MPEPLPRIRMNLDFMPSPSPDHPGLFIRDPYKFSDAMLVIPPPLVECLECFDGVQSELDLRAALVRITGQLDVGELQQHLIDTLSEAGFLEDERLARMQEERKREFAAATVREPAHAGSAYPEEAPELRDMLAQYMEDIPAPARDGLSQADPSTGDLSTRDLSTRDLSTRDLPAGDLFAIAAPHVSPQGGWESYRAAYGLLRPEHKNRTFVILATSHYGEPEKFGLTRKTFRTPLGDARPDTALVDWLAARGGAGVEMEDYCHSFEHTVEFQVIFLQHMLGPDVKILPVLVGPFARSIYQGGAPEDDDKVRAFFDALSELREREGDNLFWVMGVDMAHMGTRYRDPFAAVAGKNEMEEVAARDAQRIERINALDAGGFWELVRQRHPYDLKWCGSSPFYTFLKTAGKARGELLRYEQWNIDDHSVVSFAGMGFRKPQSQPQP